jgi:hypothetical protein
VQLSAPVRDRGPVHGGASMIAQYSGTLATIAKEHPVLGLGLCVHESTRGKPLSFKARPYLVEIYADARSLDEVCFMKAVQTGISELEIQVMLDAAGWRGRIAAYILPTYSVRNRFVQQRINPLLKRVRAYRDRSQGGDIEDLGQRNQKQKTGGGNLALKRFGSGALLFMGSGTDNDFVEFSADMMIVDEYDRCKQENLALASDRLRESPYPQKVWISNPTLPGVGIADMYKSASDRRKWFHQCDRCGERQHIDWFVNVVERNDAGKYRLRDRARDEPGAFPRPICRRCRRPFERTPAGGLWVPELSGPGLMRGYQMSRLDVLDESLFDLFDEWAKAQGNPEKIKAFYRSVLGRPFEFEGSQLSVEQLEAVLDNDVSMDHVGGDHYSKRVVVAGVDVGAVLHVNVAIVEYDEDSENPLRNEVLTCTVSSFEAVADILRRFHVDIAVVDAMPEIHKAQELRDEFVNDGGCQVWLCRFYPTPRVGAQKYGMRLDYQARIVQVDRTSVFDVSFNDIVEGRRSFPADVLAVEAWVEQMRAPVRVVDRDKGRITWTEGNRDDHFRLADVYERVAADLLGMGGSYFAG